MSLTEKDVRYVAKLSALSLSEGDVAKMQNQLNDILEYVAQLQKVSSLGVVPTSHVHGATNFFRDDIIKDSLPVEEAEKNAPAFEQGFFRVPKIIG